MPIDILDVLNPNPLFGFGTGAVNPTPARAAVAVYTSTIGPGYTSPQTHASGSRGGFASTTEWFGGVAFDLFGLASTVDVQQNRADYRCLFVFNDDPTATVTGARAYLDRLTAGAVLAVGADPRPVNRADALSPQAVTTDTGYLAPPGVTFSTPAFYASGVVLGDLPPGYGKALWLKRTPTTSASAAAETCVLTVEHAGGVAWDRQVVWQTEIAAQKTEPSPLVAELYRPTPTPFLRAQVDFLSTGGSRIIWELDATLQDEGPYDFQLQISQSGPAGSDDWTDVGPPARDPAYLIDPNARLWGMSTTTHYRVVLTTATDTYTSPAASAYNGVIHRRDWLIVQEIVRKERMNQNEFVGTSGLLLKARRYGARCTCTNATSGERYNSSCLTCYGVGIVGGYHPPVPATFATLDGESTTEQVQYNENLGTTRPVTVTGRVIADIPVVHEDAWISTAGDDLRYKVWSVIELGSVQGQPVVYQVELRAVPRSNVLHQFPVVRPPNSPVAWAQETVLNL